MNRNAAKKRNNLYRGGERMANVKGLALVACGNYLKEHFSETELNKVRMQIGDARYSMLMDPLVGSMYPMDDFIMINTAIADILGRGNISILREIGRASADEANRGIYRIFFKVGSPQFIIKKAAVIFSKYYDKGNLSVKEMGDTNTTVELVDFDYKDKTKYICTRVEGWVERTLDITSGKKVTTHQAKCIAHGDSSCIFESTW
jgi:hypothetical protein